MGAASVDEARLENIRSYELDGAQRFPVEIEFSSVRKVEPLQRECHFASAVRYPPWLGVTRCLTTAGGVSDSRARQRADHKARAAEGSNISVCVPPVTEGSPGLALCRSYSKCTIAVLQSRGRGHNRSADHLSFKDIGEDVARVPEVFVRRATMTVGWGSLAAVQRGWPLHSSFPSGVEGSRSSLLRLSRLSTCQPVNCPQT